MSRSHFALLLSLLCSGVAGAETLGPDGIPWPPESAISKAATRTRWLFRPDDPALSRAQLAAPGEESQVDLIAELPRFGELWILEAPAGQEASVEALWSGLGNLRRDRSGEPQLFESTRLVAAFNTWSQLDVWGDRTQSVAILDSGADTAHDDLGDPDDDNHDDPPLAAGDADDWVDAAAGYSKSDLIRVVGWHDVSDDMPGHLGPYDYHRHGTALAGVAFASGRADSRYRGVAPEGRAVIVKTYNFEGQWQLWASDLLLGIDWLLTHRDSHRIRVALIGASWPEDLDISTGVDALLDAGIAVIAPAGNDPDGAMGYPARLDDVITVGATDEQGLIAAYSTPDPGIARYLDLVAPGGTLLSPNATVITCDNEPNDGYRGRVGTSIAAAHVAGGCSLVLEVMREGGRAWRNDRDQVRWLRSLLSVTAAETEGAESGAPRLPTRDRIGWDRAEGSGLLQLRAAVEGVRRFHWPGDLEQFLLNSPRINDAVWAARMPVWGPEALRVELSPPVDADFDLLLYLESKDGFVLRAFSAQPGLGKAERIDLEQPRSGNYLLVVRRVSGGGLATLQSERILHDDTRWPLQLSSNIARPPVTVDLDDDGRPEIVSISNLPIDPSAHTWFAFGADGRNFASFPRTYFSTTDRVGEILPPAIADFGSGPVMISGSAFGQLYAVDAQAQLKFASIVSGAARTTGVSLLPAGNKRIVVGTENGVVFLDQTGSIVDDWPAAAGVQADLLLVDLDDDGQEEVVFAEGSTLMHARDLDGVELPGWPVAIAADGLWGSPIGFGDGADARYVAWVERPSATSSRLQVVDANAVPLAGFPVDFLAPGGGTVRATGGVIASRLGASGATVLGAAASHVDASNQERFALHRFGLDGTQIRSAGEVIAAPALANSTFLVTRRLISPLRSFQLTGDEELDWILAGQLAWEELDVTQRRRYGSMKALQLWSNDSDGPLRLAETQNAHQLTPLLSAVPPTIDDLDGDGFADIIIARANRLYRQSGFLRADVGLGWTQPRADQRRSGCYRCAPDIVVSTPPAHGIELAIAPNPFNPRTVIRWSWPRAGRVEFELFDARGRSVRRWLRAIPEAGVYRDAFDGRDGSGATLASGVYRLRLRGAAGEITRNLTILR